MFGNAEYLIIQVEVFCLAASISTLHLEDGDSKAPPKRWVSYHITARRNNPEDLDMSLECAGDQKFM
jgi:hypothetical protein